jgi:chlorobactene glucosyltransferase
MSVWDWFIDSWRVLFFVGVQGVIAVTNALLMRRLGSYPKARNQPRVSVLVPARNEEATIGACVWSLLDQTYPNIEVFILDDSSTDQTAYLVSSFEKPQMHLIGGRPLPDGWTGKAWACHQLARVATGELLLFIDADEFLEPGAVEQAVNAREATGSDLLSAITRNEVRTLGEQLTVPFVVWSIVTLLPLGVAYLLRRATAFSGANGKLMLFTRQAYELIGGHAAARADATEDLALCRLVKRHGLRWRLLDATSVAGARMYGGFKEAVDGFSKNYFALFGYRVLPALFVWFWVLLITWHPIVTLAATAGRPSGATLAALLTVLCAAGQWLLVCLKFRLPLRLAPMYPLVMVVSAYTGLRSMVLSIAGRTSWKGRTLVKHRVRII